MGVREDDSKANPGVLGIEASQAFQKATDLVVWLVVISLDEVLQGVPDLSLGLFDVLEAIEYPQHLLNALTAWAPILAVVRHCLCFELVSRKPLRKTVTKPGLC